MKIFINLKTLKITFVPERKIKARPLWDFQIIKGNTVEKRKKK